MNLCYLNETDWQEFARRFPDAQSFLLERALLGELRYLRRLTRPTPWETRRLAELGAWATLGQRDTPHA